jgi:hypothetical protein
MRHLAFHSHINTKQIAEHLSRLTAFRSASVDERHFAWLLPGLSSVQHLDLGSVRITSSAPLHALTLHCSQLKSLSLRCEVIGRDVDFATEIGHVCRNLTLIEGLWVLAGTGNWVAEELLAILGAHCKCLLYLCLVSTHSEIAVSAAGTAALRQGCPLLDNVFVEQEHLGHGRLLARSSQHTFAQRPFWRQFQRDWLEL